MNEQRTINGKQFYDALISGISNLIAHHEHLNKINVFPVPDGDTGTNLLFTLKPITLINTNQISNSFNITINRIANTAIDSARGNSGTIIAQYFVGMAEESENTIALDSNSIAQIFQSGYQAALGAMSDPKEGTIISVMREAALSAKNNSDNSDLEETLKNIYNSSVDALRKTPEQMKLLKDSGVVDAGAQGYVNILEGMLYFVENNKIMNQNIIDKLSFNDVNMNANIDSHDNPKFQFCTECIINGNQINRQEIKNKLDELGDSLIIAGTKSKVKIHIHTDDPNDVFKLCELYGTLSNQKADDMLQQVESVKNNSTIAIVTDSGCDIAINSHNSNIHVVNVKYSFGEKEYIDKVSQTSEEFYNELINNPIHPKTSQPAIGDFLNKFDYLSSHYKSAISIHIPEKLSGTIQSCRNAIDKIDDFEITPIDSLSASVGLGLIVKSADEIVSTIDDHNEAVEKIKSLIKNTQIFLAIKDVNYAIKGGRIPKLHGKIVDYLNIKPILTTNEKGNLKLAGAFFGARNLNKKIGDFILKKLDNKYHYRISIAHSNVESQGNELINYLQDNFNNIDDIDLVDLGSALGVHAGPGACAIGLQRVNNE